MKLSKRYIKIISLILSIHLFCPAQLYAKSIEAKKPTVLFVPVGSHTDTFKSENKEIIQKIRKDLKGQINSLSTSLTKQIQKIDLNATNDPKLSQAVQLTNDALDNYSAYSANAKETIQALEVIIDYLHQEVSPSEQASELMITALMTKAWLLFKQRKKELSQTVLVNLIELSPKLDLQLSYYPPNFRKFFNKVKSVSHPNSHTAVIQTTPESVQVFVNHIFVGVSPLTLTLPAKDYTLGFYATGRKPITKALNLSKDDHKSIKVRLSWDKDNLNSKEIQNFDWNELPRQQKLVFATHLASASNADKAVFWNIKSNKKGYLPQATIFDSNYSQLMKTISYPKSVSNIESSQQEISNYFVKKLTPLLSQSSVTYWSKEIDRDIIVDHRIATHRKKPLYKKPLFWAITLGTIAAGTVTAIALSHSSPNPTGNLTVDFGGF